MFSNIETFLLYNVVLILTSFLSWQGEKRGQRRFIFCAYVILFLLSSLRFDIGNDYENFYNNIVRLSPYGIVDGLWNVIDDYKIGAIMVPIITGLVPYTKMSPVIVIAVYAFIFLFFVFLVLDKYHAHTIGVFLLFIMIFLFKSWDWIKQGVAVAIFLYASRYIIEKKCMKFIAWILFASLWHISALFTLLVYPLTKIRVRPKLLAVLLFLCFLLTEFGGFRGLYEYVVAKIPYYNEVYEMTKYSEQDNYSFAYSKTFIINSVWLMLLLYFAPPHIYRTV